MNGNPLTVLVVDDDPETVKVFDYFLKKQGHRSLLARTVPEALEHLEEITPDVILLDLMLPGQNGEVLLKHVRLDSHLENTHVIVVSAHPLDERNLPTGVYPDDILRKPIRIHQLEHAIMKALV